MEVLSGDDEHVGCAPIDLQSTYWVSPVRGFLPPDDPLEYFHKIKEYEKLLASLTKVEDTSKGIRACKEAELEGIGFRIENVNEQTRTRALERERERMIFKLKMEANNAFRDRQPQELAELSGLQEGLPYPDLDDSRSISDRLARSPVNENTHSTMSASLERIISLTTRERINAALNGEIGSRFGNFDSAHWEREILSWSDRQLQRAYVVFSILVHSYIFADFAEPLKSYRQSGNGTGGNLEENAIPTVPSLLALPYYLICQKLGFSKPVLTHSGQDLWNWRWSHSGAKVRTNDNLETLDTVHHLEMISQFTTRSDEAYFHLPLTQIAFIFGRYVTKMWNMQEVMVNSLANTNGTVTDITELLTPTIKQLRILLDELSARLKICEQLLLFLRDNVEPQWFYHDFRFYLQGWGTNDTVPNGVVFEGVSDAAADDTVSDVAAKRVNEGLLVTETGGGSGAQDANIQLLDIFLGVEHDTNFLKDQRTYMPMKHRNFVNEMEARGFKTLPGNAEAQTTSQGHGNVKGFVAKVKETVSVGNLESSALVEEACLLENSYKETINLLSRFRSCHYSLVQTHILAMKRKMDSVIPDANPYYYEVAQLKADILKAERKTAAATVETAESHEVEKGTGGTDLKQFLQETLTETWETAESECVQIANMFQSRQAPGYDCGSRRRNRRHSVS